MTERLPTVCIIPAKLTSRRVPEKNLQKIDGVPLLVRTIRTYQDSGCFDYIGVSSESERVREATAEAGAIWLMRPDALSDPYSTMKDVVLYHLPSLPFAPTEFYLAVGVATSALLDPGDVAGAVNLCRSTGRATMIVTELPYLLSEVLGEEDGHLAPVLGQGRSRDHGTRYVDAGALYVFPPFTFQRHQTFYPPDLQGYKVPRVRAVDINVPDDLHLARALYHYRKLGYPE